MTDNYPTASVKFDSLLREDGIMVLCGIATGMNVSIVDINYAVLPTDMHESFTIANTADGQLIVHFETEEDKLRWELSFSQEAFNKLMTEKMVEKLQKIHDELVDWQDTITGRVK